MNEFMPAEPETIKKPIALEKEPSAEELVEKFQENRKKIGEVLSGEHDVGQVESDDRDTHERPYEKLIGQETKQIIREERKRSKVHLSLAQENTEILERISVLDNEKAYEFVWGEVKLDGDFYFEYPEKTLEIFKKKGKEALRNVLGRISQGVESHDYFIYASILEELGSKTEDLLGAEEIEKLSEKMQGSKADIFFLSTMLKTAKENGEKVDFETMKGLKFERRLIGEKDENGKETEFSDKEKKEMVEMVEENYREAVYPDKPQTAQWMVGEFEKELASENINGQTVFTLRFQGQLVAFCRFKPIGKEEMYAGSLNIHKEAANANVAKYFSSAALWEMSKRYRIRAITRASNEAISLYKKQGFIIDEKHPFEEEGDVFYNMAMEKRGEVGGAEYAEAA